MLLFNYKLFNFYFILLNYFYIIYFIYFIEEPLVDPKNIKRGLGRIKSFFHSQNPYIKNKSTKKLDNFTLALNLKQ